MANCPKCNQPLNVGNIKIGKNGRREHRRCPEIKQLHSKEAVMPSQSTKANPVRTTKANPSVIPEAQIGSRLPFRLFMKPSSVENIKRLAALPRVSDSVFHMIIIPDPTLPDRDPENFQDLIEVRIG